MRRFVVIDPFCYKQFDPVSPSVYIPYDRQAFESRLNELFPTSPLHDGYAPFCKHLFLPNFTPTPPGALEITLENQSFLESGYEARTAKELPVLSRWFPRKQFEAMPPAAYLDVILYTKEQIQEENGAMGNTDPNTDVDYLFGVVGVKPQNEDYELPMQPITMFRNALGKAEGGSGHPLDPAKYRQSVAYWSTHAILK